MERENFIKWVKTHKRELVFAGVSVTAVIAIIVGFQKQEDLLSLWTELEGKISIYSQCDNSITVVNETNEILKSDLSAVVLPIETAVEHKLPQEVSSHIRNLHEGWKASAEKIATAAEHDFELQPGQTWVESYLKYQTVA